MRKVHVKLTVDLFLNTNDDVNIGEVIDEMHYNFTSNTSGAFIEDSEIEDYEVTDSR